jgi:TldD protein
MTNTFIAPGKHRFEDIISSTDFGLYAKKLGGGSVVPATGEYNFSVTEGYMIRHGRIAEPVRGATLIGRGDRTLLDIDMVSEGLRLEQGTCGSASGSVPVSVGQSVIRVRELTVGGRG